MPRMSRSVVNFQRLLKQCNVLSRSSELTESDLVRLNAYIGHLKKLLVEVHEELPADVLSDYKSQLDFLARVVVVEKKPAGDERLLCVQQLGCSSSSSQSHTHTSSSSGDQRAIKHTAHIRSVKHLREQLFGASEVSAGGAGVRLRALGDAQEEAMLQQHADQMQEAYVEQLLLGAQSMKHMSHAAKSVIDQDKQTLTRVNAAAEATTGRLGVEGARLELIAHASWCDCMLFLLILAVCLAFVAMVLFMRFVPKPVVY